MDASRQSQSKPETMSPLERQAYEAWKQMGDAIAAAYRARLRVLARFARDLERVARRMT